MTVLFAGSESLLFLFPESKGQSVFQRAQIHGKLLFAFPVPGQTVPTLHNSGCHARAETHIRACYALKSFKNALALCHAGTPTRRGAGKGPGRGLMHGAVTASKGDKKGVFAVC